MLEDRDAFVVKYECYRSWKWNVGNLFIAAVMDSPFSRTHGETILLYVTADHNISKFADTPISMSYGMLIPCPCSNLTSVPFYYGHDRYISFCYASESRCRRHYIFRLFIWCLSGEVSGHFPENARKEWLPIWHAAVSGTPSQLIRFWS